MEKEDLDELISIIKSIDKKTSELERYLSNLNLFSRNNMLKELVSDIINKNQFFQNIKVRDDEIIIIEGNVEKFSCENYIEQLNLKIQDEPSKKIVIIKDFLNLLDGISKNDLNVLLKSLKDKNHEDLIKELVRLTKIFNMKCNK